MHKIKLEDATSLTFVGLVLRVMETFEQEIPFDWIEPGYNFYLKKYRIGLIGDSLWIRWVNLQGEDHYIEYHKNPFENKFIRSIFSKLKKSVAMSDGTRSLDVFNKVIYPDFCKRLELTDYDFSRVTSLDEATEHILCSVYNNFFSSISLDRYFNMFNLEHFVSKKSLQVIKEHCDTIYKESEVEYEKTGECTEDL